MHAVHTLNLGFRFALELAALFAMGRWGWAQGSGFWRFALALGVPAVAAVLWGVFRVPNDPGPAPVAVPGAVRLLLEIAFFGFAVWALWDTGAVTWAWVFAAALLLHYALDLPRVRWLLQQ
jgi:hypothetical protein